MKVRRVAVSTLGLSRAAAVHGFIAPAPLRLLSKHQPSSVAGSSSLVRGMAAATAASGSRRSLGRRKSARAATTEGRRGGDRAGKFRAPEISIRVVDDGEEYCVAVTVTAETAAPTRDKEEGEDGNDDIWNGGLGDDGNWDTKQEDSIWSRPGGNRRSSRENYVVLRSWDDAKSLQDLLCAKVGQGLLPPLPGRGASPDKLELYLKVLLGSEACVASADSPLLHFLEVEGRTWASPSPRGYSSTRPSSSPSTSATTTTTTTTTTTAAPSSSSSSSPSSSSSEFLPVLEGEVLSEDDPAFFQQPHQRRRRKRFRTADPDRDASEGAEKSDATIAGAVIGGLVAGPVGAMVGGLLGREGVEKDGYIGDLARGAGEATRAVKDKARDLDKQFDLRNTAGRRGLDLARRAGRRTGEILKGAGERISRAAEDSDGDDGEGAGRTNRASRGGR